MRHTKIQPLGQVIKEYMKQFRLEQKRKELGVNRHWPVVVGDFIASQTQSLVIRNRTLYVKFNSAALRNELFMRRQWLMDKMNEEAGEKIIDRIVLQ